MRYFLSFIILFTCQIQSFSQIALDVDSIVSLHYEYFQRIREAEESGNHLESISYGIKDAELLKEYCGENNSLYLDAMIFLAYLFYGNGDYNNSLNTINTVVNLSNKYLPETVDIYIKSLDSQMRLSYGAKHFDDCIESALLLLENLTKSDSSSDDLFLDVIGIIGDCYKEKGEYIRAIEFYKLVLNNCQIPRKIVEVKSKISDCYSMIGDIKSAIQYIDEAFELLSKNNFEDVDTSIRLCVDLSKLYFSILDIPNAIGWIKLAENIHQSYYQNRKNSVYAQICIMKSIILLSGGDAKLALPFANEACEILKKQFGVYSRHYTDALDLLSMVYAHNNETQKAVELAEQSCYYISLSDSANNYRNVIKKQNNLCSAYLMNKQYDKMVECAHLYIKNIGGMIYEQFMLSDKALRKSIWSGVRSSEALKSPLYKSVREAIRNKEELSRCIYDLILVSKGLLLTSEKYYNKMLFEKGYDNKDDISSLEIRMDLQLNPQLQNTLNITWESVRSFLDTQDLAVEFIESPDSFIIAVFLRKGWKAPKMIEICNLHQLLEYKNNINLTYSTTGLGQLIWNNILKESGVNRGDCIYFSTDGILSLLNIESVPFTDSLFISDLYQLRRLSSTREIPIAKRNSTLDFHECQYSLYGGIDYDSDISSSGNQKSKYKDYFFSNQLIDSLSIQRGSFNYLPGTKNEIDSIYIILKKNNIKENKIQIYQSVEATEESIKNLTIHKPGILHIATHGYYIKPTEEELRVGRMSEVQKFLYQDSFKEEVDLVDYGMSRTGLLFAGANNISEKQRKAGGKTEYEDGYLTSKEISLLNLSGIDMIILPVCLSATGTITYDGISGLQRGFKIAGVKTILMSLWEVDDDATALMMISFYNALLQSGSKYDAFRKAQSVVRERYGDAYYWASFIILD